MESRLHNDKLERRIGEALKQADTEPARDCIAEETLWEFVEQQGKHLEAKRIVSHLAECLHCYQGYSNMLEFQRLSAAAQKAGKPEPTLSPLESLLRRLRLPNARTSLQAGGLALATGLAVFLLCFRYLRPSTVVSGDLQREGKLHLRETAAAARSQAADKQIALAKQREQAAEAALKRLANAAKAQQAAQTIATRPVRPETLDPQKWTYTPSEDVGIEMHGLSGGESANPLPFALHGPLPDATVRHDTVVFQWSAFSFPSKSGGREMAKSYRVEFWRQDRPNEPPGQSPVLKTPFWKPDFGKGPLPGGVYVWNVYAYRDADGKDPLPFQSPQGNIRFKFRTLSQTELNHLTAARDSSLRAGAILAKAGMWKESEQAFDAYLLASPRDAQAQQGIQKARSLRQVWLRSLAARLEQLSRLAGGKESEGVKEMRRRVATELSEK